MYKQPLTLRSWVFSSQGCKKCTVLHFNFTLLQVKVEDMCAKAEITKPNYLFPVILTINCKARLENTVLELMSLQLFPWRHSSPAPFALVSVSSVQNLSLGQIWLSSPISQNNTLEALLLQTWWNMCFIFSALSAHITKEKKKSQIWFQREEVASTFSINALLKKMLILDQNLVLKLSGVINKQLNLRVLTDSILLRKKQLKSFSTFQYRTSPSPLVSSLVSRRWHIILQ